MIDMILSDGGLSTTCWNIAMDASVCRRSSRAMNSLAVMSVGRLMPRCLKYPITANDAANNRPSAAPHVTSCMPKFLSVLDDDCLVACFFIQSSLMRTHLYVYRISFIWASSSGSGTYPTSRSPYVLLCVNSMNTCLL